MSKPDIIINKTMDRADLKEDGIPAIRRSLDKFARKLFFKGIPFSVNGYLRWNYHIGWYKLWEYARGFKYCGIEKGMKVLDVGGAATVPVFYAAARGCSVYSVDIDEKLVRHTKKASKKKGWNIHAACINLCEGELPEDWDGFDVAVSFCVIEHINEEGRQKLLKKIGERLKPGGVMAITFDYGQNAPTQSPLRSVNDIKRIISQTGLGLCGNAEFADNSKLYMLGHASRARYTFGSIFLRKVAG